MLTLPSSMAMLGRQMARNVPPHTDDGGGGGVLLPGSETLSSMVVVCIISIKCDPTHLSFISIKCDPTHLSFISIKCDQSHLSLSCNARPDFDTKNDNTGTCFMNDSHNLLTLTFHLHFMA